MSYLSLNNTLLSLNQGVVLSYIRVNDMCLINISDDLSFNLTPHTFSRLDDLISKARDLEKRLLKHKKKRRIKVVVNKMESVIV